MHSWDDVLRRKLRIGTALWVVEGLRMAVPGDEAA